MAVIHWGTLPMDSQDAQFAEAEERKARGDLLQRRHGTTLPPESSEQQTSCIRDVLYRIDRGAPAVPSPWPPCRLTPHRSLASPDGQSTAGTSSCGHQAVLDDFTEKLVSGKIADARAYLDGLGEVAPSLAVQLIYREYCLAELKGTRVDPAVFLDRFPEYRGLLDRLFSVHRACSSSQLDFWLDPTDSEDVFPEAGDEIGPYLLKRELGRGTFARVFLAEQCDLESRLVILKLSTRLTREPWLLARAQHSHIVEILSHSVVDDGAFQLICMPFLGGATLSEVLNLRRQLRRPLTLRGDLLKDLDAVAAPEYSSVNPANRRGRS